MDKFLIGLGVGFLTMTKDGKAISKKLTDGLKDNVTSYLKKEGVLEPTKDTRPVDPPKPSDKPKEQCSTNEPVDK